MTWLFFSFQAVRLWRQSEETSFDAVLQDEVAVLIPAAKDANQFAAIPERYEKLFWCSRVSEGQC